MNIAIISFLNLMQHILWAWRCFCLRMICIELMNFLLHSHFASARVRTTKIYWEKKSYWLEFTQMLLCSPRVLTYNNLYGEKYAAVRIIHLPTRAKSLLVINLRGTVCCMVSTFSQDITIPLHCTMADWHDISVQTSITILVVWTITFTPISKYTGIEGHHYLVHELSLWFSSWAISLI